jgi:hypothetical protein
MKHLGLVAITLLAFALRLVRLDFQPLWWDEGYSVFFATRDFGTMLERTAIDIHPPLYYALMQVWIFFFGKSDIALRWLSVFIGVAAIPLIYLLAKKLFDARIALIAALLLAISPFHIYYSQEVRMYGLVTLLGLASFYLCIQLIEMTPGKPKTFIVALAYILATAAALYTQYYAAFIVAVEIVIVLIRLRNNRQLFAIRNSPFAILYSSLVHWLAAWFTLALLYLPWLVYAGPKLYAYVTAKVDIEKYTPLDPITFLGQHLSAFAVGHLTDWTWLAWLGVPMIACAGLGIFARVKSNSSVTLSFLLLLALGYLVNLIFPFHPIHGERLLLFAAPAFYLLAARGIDELRQHRTLFGVIGISIVALICGASLYDFYTVPRYPQDDYRPLIADLQSVAQPNDVMLAIYPWQIGYLEAYYTGAPLNIIETPNERWNKNPAQMQNDLNQIAKKNTRVWIPALQTQGRIIETALENSLRSRTYSVIDAWYGTTRLEMLTFADDPARADYSLDFANQLSIKNWGVSKDKLTAGRDLVRLWLDAPSVNEGDYKSSLRLVDARGNVWAQDDRALNSGMQRVGLFVPLGTPPGEYDLRFALYGARDNKPLNIGERNEIMLARLSIIAPAQPNLAALPHYSAIELGNNIRYLAFNAPAFLKPGEPTPITFFWQAQQAIKQEYAIVTQIQDARGNIFATTQAAPAGGIYPTTHWQSGEIVRDLQTITLRGDTPDGNYRLTVAMIDLAHNTRTPSVDVGTVSVKGRPHYFGAPSPSTRIDARLGNVAQIVGYDASTNQRAVRIVLYWHALGTSDTSYKAFVHLLDANNVIAAQGDHIPGAGTYPTPSWVQGEYLVDVYDIDAPPGEYTIEIGMYNPADNVRLPVFDAANQPVGDHLFLPGKIRVP